MRFQKAGPDYLPLSNGKKPNFRASTIIAPSKDDGNNGDNERTIVNGEFFDGAPKGIRFRSPSRPKDLYNNNNLTHPSGSGGAPNLHTPFIDNNHHRKPKNHSHSHRLDSSPTPSPSPSNGDVLLQWRQRKRSRVSRSEIRSSNVTDDSSSSSGQGKQPDSTTSFKLRRRTFTANMPPSPSPPPPPPPPPLPSTSSPYRNNSRIVSHHKNGLPTRKESSGFISSRNLEDNSTIPNGIPTRNGGSSSRVVSRSAAGKRPLIPSIDKVDRKISCSGSARDGKQSESIAEAGNRTDRLDVARVQSGKEAAPPPPPAANAGLATSSRSVEKYPKIHISLSRKEKEEDFLAMTGSKLPHKPKKRARAVDKALQHCFPGMWLSDLSKSRYEVREKKSTKKPKWTGLKGMESESD